MSQISGQPYPYAGTTLIDGTKSVTSSATALATSTTVSGGYTTGVKADFIKATIASYVKNKIKSYRVNKARQSADVTIKQVSDSVTILDIS